MALAQATSGHHRLVHSSGPRPPHVTDPGHKMALRAAALSKWDPPQGEVCSSVHRMLGVLLLLRQEFPPPLRPHYLWVWICSLFYLWICRFVEFWICGFLNFWICGFVDLRISWQKNFQRNLPENLGKSGPEGPHRLQPKAADLSQELEKSRPLGLNFSSISYYENR